jgi:hypothetical protein
MLAAGASSIVALSSASLAVCGAVFNLHYWLGVEEALGTVETRHLLSLVEADEELDPAVGREAPQSNEAAGRF